MSRAKNGTRRPASPRSSSRWICVFELDDSVGKRRVADKPHVCVKPKAIKPGPDLEAWLEKTRAGKKPQFLKVRYDLMPKETHKGGLHKPYQYPRDKDPLNEALRQRREKLRGEGFTVNGGMDTYLVYVIELDDTHIAKKPEDYRGYVYVGQTHLTREERARQHELGPHYPWQKKPNYSRPAHSHFGRLAPELIPKRFQKKLPNRDSALRAERDLRLYLESKGYKVEGAKDLLRDT